MLKRVFSIFTALIFVLGLFSFNNIKTAYAESPLLSSDTGWAAAYPSNDQNDYIEDQQTGSGSVSQDIVGDKDTPSTYIRFTSTDVAFRIRLNDINGTSPYSFNDFAFIGIDSDCSGSVDFFVGVYNPTGNNGRVGIYKAAPGYANMSPSTTGISGKPLLAFMPQYDVNYAITPADSSIDGTQDYFISFKFSIANISSALSGTGHSFSSSSPFRFMTGTAAQDNSFNQDLNGMNEDGWSSNKIWNDLGVFSTIVTASGTDTYYMVTFDKNTGDTNAVPQTMAVKSGSALGSLPAGSPTKRGMYFQHWNTAPDGSGDMVTKDTIITGNTTFYAIWSNVAVYTVTFDPNGGNFSGSTSPVTVGTIGGVVDGNMPADPTKGTKSYFMGWQISGTSTYFNSATPVSSNMTVVAQWANTASNVAVFYDNYDSSTGGSQIAKIYSNGNSTNFNGSMPVITRPGYTFGNWCYEDKSCTVAPVSGKINDPGNYYAKWTKDTYTVTFNQNYTGCPVDTTKPVSGGVLGDMPADPTRTDYKFVEWNRTSDGKGEPMYPTSLITGNTTIYAIWNYIQNVTFNSNGGLFDDTKAGVLDETKTEWSTTATGGVLNLQPQPPSQAGFTFLGWGTAPNSTTTVSLLDVSGHNEYYAVWSPVKTVTFNENYGASPTTTTVLTAYGSVLYIPAVSTRTNFDFKGWNTQKGGGGTAFTLSTDVSDNMIVYAQWQATGTTYPVHFVTNGGSGIEDVTTAEVTDEPVSTRTGYTLKGWYTDESLNTKAYFPFAVTKETTLYADWTPNTYTVVYNGNGSGGGATSSSIHTYDVSKVLTENGFTRQYYHFAGWAETEEGVIKYSDGESVKNLTDENEGIVNLYAKWTPNTYTVVYNGNGSGGGSTASSSHTCGVSKALTSNGFTKQYYTFAGWAETAGGDVKYSDGESVSDLTDIDGGTVNLYAKWTPNTYTVVYNGNGSDGGSTASSSHICDESKALTANGFTLEGYDFSGWALSEEGEIKYTDGETVINLTDANGGTVNLFAIWEPAGTPKYTVSYVTNGGSEIAGQTTNKVINKPVSTRDGYILKDWYTDEELNNKADFPYSVEKDTVFYAEWTPITYSVVYNGNGDDGGSTDTSSHTYDVSKALTSNGFTRQYYHFAGWAETPGGDVKYSNEQSVKNLTDVDGGTINLYAKWTANTYTVKYNKNGGTGGTTASSSHTCYIEKELTANGFTRQYYAFRGWAVTPTGDLEYADQELVVNLTDEDGGTVNLYAKWLAEPDLTSSVSGGIIYEDGRIILTPNIPGGTWDFDPEYLSFNGTSFTGLQPGTTIVTYTVDGVTVQYTITIEANDLPATGQDFTAVYILALLALVVFAGGLFIRIKKETGH